MSPPDYVVGLDNREARKGYKIARFIAQILKIPVLQSPSDCTRALRGVKPGRVLVVGGQYPCRHSHEASQLALRADSMVWIPTDRTNRLPVDFTNEARRLGLTLYNGQFRPPVIWTPIVEHVSYEDKWPCKVVFVNFRALSLHTPRLWGRRTETPFVYHGYWRGGRADRVAEFLPEGTRVITSEWSVPKFEEHIEDKFLWYTPEIVDSSKLTMELARHQMTVLMQDSASDSVPEFPPHRFYEALSARTAMLMHESMADRLQYNGYAVRSRYVVRSDRDASRRLEFARSIAERQNREWIEKARWDKHRAVHDLCNFMKRLA